MRLIMPVVKNYTSVICKQLNVDKNEDASNCLHKGRLKEEQQGIRNITSVSLTRWTIISFISYTQLCH